MFKPIPAVGLRREAKVLVARAVLAQLLDHLGVAVGLGALVGAKVDRVLRQDERRRRGDDQSRQSEPHFEKGLLIATA